MPFSSLRDFGRFVPEHVVSEDDWGELSEYLETAKERIETALRQNGKYQLPLPVGSVTREIKRIECILGGFDYLYFGRGGNVPTEGTDALFVKAYDEAVKWLEKVADGYQPLPVNTAGDPIDADPLDNDSGAAIVSDASRNWNAITR